MAGRKPVHLLAAGGKPHGRQAMWQAMRRLRRFTISSLTLACEQDRTAVRSYVLSLVKSGHLTAAGTEPAPANALLRARNPRNLSAVYTLAVDIGVEAPRVRRDGSPCLQGRAREQMWRTMRMLGDFTPHELAIAASTDDSPVSEVDAADYVKHLYPAGYLMRIAAATAHNQARYRFVPARWSGPKAPMIQRLKTVFDANTRKIVWHQAVDA